MNLADRTDQERVYLFTFAVGTGDNAFEMTSRAASEQEARADIESRLAAQGMSKRPMVLEEKAYTGYVRTRRRVA